MFHNFLVGVLSILLCWALFWEEKDEEPEEKIKVEGYKMKKNGRWIDVERKIKK